MALRIANNISAMNTQRWLGVADAGMKQSLERLSSGYRINRAADDAAGLAISESFRANIASFKVASRNMSEATSMLQVAEGGMDQIGNMLTRLKELATQSASDNVTDTERSKIDSEASKLISEMERISDSTKYGSSKLLDGSFGGLSNTTGAAAETVLSAAQDLIYKFTDDSSDTAAMTVAVASDAVTKEGVWTLATGGGAVMELTNGSVTATATTTDGVFDFSEVGITLTTTAITETSNMAGDTITIAKLGIDTSAVAVGSDATAGDYTLTAGSGTVTLTGASSSQSFTGLSDGAQTLDFSTLGITLTLDSDFDTSEANLNDMTLTVAASDEKTFQIGADNDTDNRLTVQIGDTSTSASGLNVSSLSLSTQSGAQTALTTVDTAISTLADRRADIGGYQNRLGYASANIATIIENTQAAESVIRDVDMANEMTDFTKNQILLQAGTAMLAQANMAPQQVLALFG